MRTPEKVSFALTNLFRPCNASLRCKGKTRAYSAQTVAFAIASLRRQGARKTFESRLMKPASVVLQRPACNVLDPAH